MFRDKLTGYAIYENDDSLKHLQKVINASIASGVRIILADNMNDGQCSAGLFSCGILADGTVVPCLSMRSWVIDTKSIAQGNLLTTSLEWIWKTCFAEYRFKCFKCCKDHCGNKKINIATSYPMIKLDTGGTNDDTLKELKKKFPKQEIYLYGVCPNPPIITLYGVSPNEVVVYGVSPNIYMYAVVPNNVIAYAVIGTETTGNDVQKYWTYDSNANPENKKHK